MVKTMVRVGIIGGGLMGREVASALARWFVLEDFPVRAELVAVCDLSDKAREWFRTGSHRAIIHGGSPRIAG